MNADRRQGSAGYRAMYRATRGVAWVATVFTAVVVALLFANYFRVGSVDPVDTDVIDRLLETIEQQPENESLKEGVRDFDLLARKVYFTSRDSVRIGAWLLLGGACVLLSCVKILTSLRKKLPDPAQWLEDEYGARSAGRARHAVTAFGMLLLVVAGFLIAFYDTGLEVLPDPGETKIDYPEWSEFEKNWPSFRGPGGYGVAVATTVPTAWDGMTGQGILWKTRVPRPGFNSPVVWGDRVFLSGESEHIQEVFCFDTETGALRWRREVGHVPGSPVNWPKVTEDTGYAAPTMSTDGRHVFALFATGDLAALDMDGNLVWARNLGVPKNSYGHASSLIVYRNLLVVQYDHARGARVMALDTANGRQVWETPRQVATSWSSPSIIHTGERTELILNAKPFVISYDPKSGQEWWRIKCMDGEVAPSLAYAVGMVFAVTDYVRLAAIDLAQTNMVWERLDDLPDVPSPVATDDYVFLATSYGMVTCLERTSGKVLWQHEYGDEIYSSPILVGENVYLMNKEGVTHIFKAGGTFIPVGDSKLGEPATSIPAFLPGRIFIRGFHHLYGIGARRD